MPKIQGGRNPHPAGDHTAGLPDDGRVSSPASTGGAGTIFEQHVDAYWLAQLLVRGIPPILLDCAVVEVHLQTEHLGWHTDDFLIVGENGSGGRRKLAGQVKRTFTVSATDEDCRKAVQDFWKDFRNPQLFEVTADRFALVTLRGTTTLLEHFSALLDAARAACNGAEFEHRLAAPGFISGKAIRHCDQIRTIIGGIEEREISAADAWQFLRVLHVLSLDLNSATSQTEAMIKTMLAHTAGEHDAISAADSSWNALLCEVCRGMPQSMRFQRDDLPTALRQRHSPIKAADQQTLRALREHSTLVLDGIRSTIGSDLHLGRGHLVQQVLENLESTQVVLLSGAAGSGKSAVAKDAIGILAADHFAFSFRAEEFARAHLDETLHSAQIPASAAVLGAILASQDRKVLLVESLERLLEKSTRDAFTDLVTLVMKDRSWRLVLTCRDYSTDLVRSCFLGFAPANHSVIMVPPLADEELKEVEAAHPTVAFPLANPALRPVLRNPYFLDMALRIRWSEARPLPENERDFRTLFWQKIVCADDRLTSGMPRRRGEAFVQIALRRARALTSHVPCNDLDPEAVDGLRHDSLIESPLPTGVLVASAHDVLEDWAILQWMEELYVKSDGSVDSLSAEIGTSPAVRRTYRKWVTELVERNRGAADRLFGPALVAGLPAPFRDDTLASLLRSPCSAAFLEGHSAELLANNKQLLRRVIHLLRVACMTTPAGMGTATAGLSLFNVPDGPAWSCVLRLVQTHMESFGAGDCPLLLGFIQDWTRGVTWQDPYPEGAASVAAIAHWILPRVHDYRSGDQRTRTLKVIAKIPDADRDRFSALLQGNHDGEKRNPATEDFRKLIFEGLEGMPAARDIPEAVASGAKQFLLCSEADLRQEWSYATTSMGLETLFGIQDGRNLDYFPASAYRGPFLALLRHHPRRGLALVTEIINHSADWYAQPRVRSDYVERPYEMTLTFADGTTRKQWCNSRLWNLYRGTSVGPYVLQSVLMALENWLLALGDACPEDLDAILLGLLRRSDSAALTGVAASAATAFPHAAGETLLVLLRSPQCILLDRQRLAQELPGGLSSSIPQLDARNRIYNEERKDADARPHRRYDIETAILNLQLGPLAVRVHEILDRHRADMPPLEKQQEGAATWRLALHRMDLRLYTAGEDADEASVTPGVRSAAENGRQYVRLTPIVPEPDLKKMADESAAQLESMNARVGLLMWGLKVFGHEDGATYDPAQWRPRLLEARTAITGGNGADEPDLGRGGPGFVAAVCVRDHWEEMSGDERDWCVDVVCSEVERDGDHWDHFARVQRGGMCADRPCAWVVPILLGKNLPEKQVARARQTFVVALTHAINEVRWYAAMGIGQNLWVINRELALRCVDALATEAASVECATDAEISRPEATPRELLNIEAEAALAVRRAFFAAGGIRENAHETLDVTRWFGAAANRHIMAILGQAPNEPAAIAAFGRLSHTFVGWWDEDADRRGSPGRQRRERNHETEKALSDLLYNFLLRTAAPAAVTILQPILDAVDRHPREIHWFIQGLIGVEDCIQNTAQFWSLWELFASKVRCAKWLAEIDGEYASDDEMISAIFLGPWWKEDVRHWRSLEGHASRIHALFEDLPPSATVLHYYSRFLYRIGEQSLPNAFILIAKRLQAGNAQEMMANGDTVFLLEALLQRHVYGRPLELKRQSTLREAVLFLLDLLVENGSSAAFRMRDDFVTPVSTDAAAS